MTKGWKWNKKPNNGCTGGGDNTPPYSSLHKHNINKKGNMDNAQEGVKEQQMKEGEGTMFTAHLKRTKTKIGNDGG